MKNISEIIKLGESQTIEFKRAKEELPQNLFETVCLFLNRNGGTILLGVNDNKTIEGINPDKAETLCKNIILQSNNALKLFPTFILDTKIIQFQDKTLISIYIPISSQVHKCNNKIFDRGSDGDFEITSSEQIKNLYLRKSSLYSENLIYPFLESADFEKEIVNRTRKIIRIIRPNHPWNELSDDEFFRTSGLYRKDMATGNEGFTMSALLLFGKPEAIGSAIPHYKIDALLCISDTERYDDKESIKCNLIEAWDKLLNFVSKHLPDKFFLEGTQRISLRDTIFREIITNLLIHREYSNAFPSTFIIYNDRLEIKNANKPHVYGQLIPSELEPFPKNPHIAQIFTQMGRSEELGTGIRKVYKYSKLYSGQDDIKFLEHDIFTTVIPLSIHFFDVFLKDKKSNGEIKGDINGEIKGEIKSVYILIQNNPGIKTKNIANLVNKPKKTVDKYIKKLKVINKITYKGSNKTGGYFAI